LGEHEPGQNRIETIAAVGYRFTGDVRPYSSEVIPPQSTGAEIPQPRPIAKLPARLRWLTFAIAVFLVLAGTVWWRLVPGRAARIRSLAVMPFANLTGDPQQEYLGEGISDALLTDFAQISGLRVVSASSAARRAGGEHDGSIRQELHVDALVEGAVLKNREQLVVDVRLVQAADDRTLWTARFDMSPRDLLGLNYTISRNLARQLQSPGNKRGTAAPSSVGTANVEAYEEYLKGRFFWNKRMKDAYVKAIAYFNHAIALDPKYGQAYAGLAVFLCAAGFPAKCGNPPARRPCPGPKQRR
jgi:TolB-like protein